MLKGGIQWQLGNCISKVISTGQIESEGCNKARSARQTARSRHIESTTGSTSARVNVETAWSDVSGLNRHQRVLRGWQMGNYRYLLLIVRSVGGFSSAFRENYSFSIFCQVWWSFDLLPTGGVALCWYLLWLLYCYRMWTVQSIDRADKSFWRLQRAKQNVCVSGLTEIKSCEMYPLIQTRFNFEGDSDK